MTQAKWKQWLPAGIAVGALLWFLLLKSYSLNLHDGDEGIYHYVAKLVMEGYSPHKDFFFAHPPFASFILGVLQSIFGYSLFYTKLVPIASSCITGICTYLIARRLSGNTAAVIAMMLFLFTYDQMRSASHFTGANFTVALLMLTILVRIYRMPFLAGILAACAVWSRAYAVPIIGILLIEQFFAHRKEFQNMILGFAIVSVLMGGWILLKSGIQEPWQQLVLYHLNKPTMSDSSRYDAIVQLFYHDFWILFLGILGAATALWLGLQAYMQRRKLPEEMHWMVLLIVPAGLIHFFFAFNTSRSVTYYFLPSFPLFAILAGAFVVYVAQMIKKSIAGTRMTEKTVLLFSITIATMFIGFLAKEYFHQEIGYVQSRAGNLREYTWQNPVLPASLDDAIRSIVWRNPRNVGRQHWNINHYFWHESRWFDAVHDIVSQVKEHSEPNETILGHSSAAPLVSFLSGRRIAHNEADTNAMRFISNASKTEEFLQKLETNPPKVLVLEDSGGLLVVDAIEEYRDQYYERVSSHPSSTTSRVYEVWVRKE